MLDIGVLLVWMRLDRWQFFTDRKEISVLAVIWTWSREDREVSFILIYCRADREYTGQLVFHENDNYIRVAENLSQE